jgi:hypothetical protein
MSGRLAAGIAATIAAVSGLLLLIRRSQARTESTAALIEEDRQAELIKRYAPVLDAVARDEGMV